jgi:hypothetical protein
MWALERDPSIVILFVIGHVMDALQEALLVLAQTMRTLCRSFFIACREPGLR